MSVKVLHVFDRYLNHTMNWAYNLLSSTSEVEHFVTSFIYFENQYQNKNWIFHKTWFQRLFDYSSNEWQINWPMMIYGKGAKKYHVGSTIAFCKEQNIKIIHAHFATIGNHYMEACRKHGLTLIVSFYGYDYVKATRLKIGYYQRLFEIAEKILVEGEYGKQTLVRQGCDESKIIVQHLGVKIKKQQRPRNREGKALKIFQPASFLEKKGQLDSVCALERAVTKGYQIQLTLMGEVIDEDYYTRVKERSRDLINSGHVRFEDFLPFHEFTTYLNQFDVLFQPSRHAPDGDCEGGAPISLLHAQSIGIPVIATQHCDIPEVVVHGKTGLLSQEGDVEALARSIMRFCDMTDDEYRSYSTGGINHVSEHYDLNKCGKHLANIYQKLGDH